MKKIYLLAIGLISVVATAQLTDNFDDYAPGDVSPQAPHIILWPGAPSDAQVSTTFANSAPNSMWVRNNNADDVIVQLGDKTSGTWTVSFNVYVTPGGTGFWNIQDNEMADPAKWNGQFFVGLTGSGGVAGNVTTDLDAFLGAVPYTEGTWFPVSHVVNLDDQTLVVTVNGQELYNGDYMEGTSGIPSTQLGGINFYSIDTANNLYIDDFVLVEGVASTEDFAFAQFSVYPNPVIDILNIKSNEVVQAISIYNVLGQKVNQVSPKVASPSVDMSALKSGVYFVEVTIAGHTQTVKVVK